MLLTDALVANVTRRVTICRDVDELQGIATSMRRYFGSHPRLVPVLALAQGRLEELALVRAAPSIELAAFSPRRSCGAHR
jgi:hypothetical protein